MRLLANTLVLLLPEGSALDRTLTMLEWLAGVLAVVLVVVAFLAWSAYKKNKDARITRDE